MKDLFCLYVSETIFCSYQPEDVQCANLIVLLRLQSDCSHSWLRSLKKRILVMLWRSGIRRYCKYVHSPVEMKFLHLQKTFHAYFFSGLDKKWAWRLPIKINHDNLKQSLTYQSVPSITISPGNPGANFLNLTNPSHPRKVFRRIPYPWASLILFIK